ncbi:NAD-dependent epimerase/dehydratase family protein [Allopontixanthobacter sediminis]|uniref:NAD-dependent epimerase/dehydratase family protein n=1 Tax=Allopontixanthobacter sediminis TaxID=1689985 RepID=A0A845B205_9SPHN|nr:NAD(P)-dependent oxidoreductase [Allopontixanthobacter sediminis]MXP44318.1 NAD-dependent epimerase/dehydratase family protein [Allopontixanthobacter sediminis]
MKGTVCLVTGATGFIGSHLVRELASRGADVHAAARSGSAPGSLEPSSGRVTHHRLDLRDRAALERCITSVQPQKVFHLAAQTRDPASQSISDLAKSFADCIDPLVHLLDLLAGAASPPQVMVRAGTIAEYGKAMLPYREDQREYPQSPYGARMLAATQICEMLDARVPFPVHTARLALTYGDGQSHGFLLPALIDACRKGLPTEILRPDDRRDLIHVSDVVDALIRLGESGLAEGTTVNIATGTAPTMRDVAARVIAISGCDPALVTLGSPGPCVKPSVLLASPAKAQRQLGWSARIALDDGLRMMLGRAMQEDLHADVQVRARCG